MRAWMVLGVFWMAAPMLARAVLLGWWLQTGAPEATWGAALVGVCLGALQDVWIGAQALALAWVVRRAGGERVGMVGGLAVLGVLWAAYVLWLLIDVLLYLNIDLRMTSAFWHFFLDAEVFWDSAQGAGLASLGVGLAAVVAVDVWVLRKFGRALMALKINRRQGVWGGFAGAFAGVLAVGGALWGPGELMYISNNAALTDQIDAVRRWLGLDDPLLTAALDADAGALIVRDAPEEIAQFVDPARWPLLRDTQGFVGPTWFDLKLAPGERPHVVLLVMESLRGKDVGVMGGRYGVTPQLDRLSREGLFWTQFSACGVQTTRAVTALLFGIPPRFTEDAVQADLNPPALIGLADIFKSQGYTTAYLHNGELDFERMGQFFSAHAFETVIGHLDLLKEKPDAAQFSWGVHDEYLMEYMLDWLAARDAAKTPAFITAFTISNHHPWTLPPHWSPIHLPIPADTTYGKFLRAMHYSDATLGQFIDGLRARGLAERTIVIITADTSQAMGDRYDSFNLSRALFQENVSIPLLILADGRIIPTMIDEPGSQIDILPTLLDALELKNIRNHAWGRSLRRQIPNRVATFNSPFALRYQGLRTGQWKYWYALRSRTPHLYDLSKDPHELHNLAQSLPDLASSLHLLLARQHLLFLTLYSQNRLSPPRP